jgi:hypothetical protein
MKKLFFTTAFLFALCHLSIAQTPLDRPKAEESVKTYMKAKNKTYKPIGFGEFFSQSYSKGLQKIAKTKEVIAYSLVHTYSVKDKTITDTYFHLNASYQVIGMNTMDEMTSLVMTELQNSPTFDSIMKSIGADVKTK